MTPEILKTGNSWEKQGGQPGRKEDRIHIEGKTPRQQTWNSYKEEAPGGKEIEVLPSLTIIITNYNVARLLRECLTSIKTENPLLLKNTVVVDNASRDNSSEIVRAEFAEVKLIPLEKNVGFAAANNVALKDCQTDFVLLLNSDTRLQPGAIEKLVSFMQTHPEVAVVGPKLTHEDGTIDWRCRRGFPSPKALFFKAVGLASHFPQNREFNAYTLAYLNPDETSGVDLVSGACMLVKTAAIQQVGLMDEGYFFHLEDIDWVWQMKKARGPTGENWKVFYLPEAEVVHHGGQSRRQIKFRASLEMLKSMKRFYQKHVAQEYSPMQRKLLEASLYPFWLIQTIKIFLRYLK